jgi:hypothetical protein
MKAARTTSPTATREQTARTLGVLWPQPQPLYVRSTRKHTKAVAAATAFQNVFEDHGEAADQDVSDAFRVQRFAEREKVVELRRA